MEKNTKTKGFIYYYKKIDSKFSSTICCLDKQILKNFKEAEIETRPVKSSGVWCCFLIPTILLLYSTLYNVSPLYKEITYLSCGLLSYSILFTLFISMSCLVLRKPMYGGCVVSSLISTLLLYVIVGKDLLPALGYSLLSVYSYKILLRQIIISFPKTFTVGEVMIIAQGMVLFTVQCLVMYFTEQDVKSDTYFINAVVLTVLSTVGLLVTALNMLTEQQRNLEVLIYLIAMAAAIVLVELHYIFGPVCLPKLLGYIFGNKERIQLFFFWLMLVASAVMVIVIRTKMGIRASSGMRKPFHILASLVFASGIIVDLDFMKLASGIIFGVLIFVEALRLSQIEPVSSYLQAAFLVYKDEKDCGRFALTPIYMYVGLACPMLLVPAHSSGRLELLSGVLATGVGDTAASWFGERYGVNRWPDGSKTLEGTAFNIISQVVTVYLLEIFELLNIKYSILRTIVAATVVGLVEARTDQVDNIILPLVMLIAFQTTYFLA